ncbi:MAG: hypothetical protein FD135_2635 [Comamonadaceae bacterium]|nr:MAG: hypothetical protein FD135_2635 [Comamonadaceae bacterium]
MNKEPDNYDTPWKEAVERYFPEFMAFYFPAAHAQIDWDKEHAFLEQELAAIVQDAELGKRHLDKLVRVSQLNGQEDWIYLHLEIQGQAQTAFAERMFVYNYRIYDRYRRPVASMAVLADDSSHWKPQAFGYDVLDCQMGIRFPIAKLMDYTGREAALQDDPNPFALVTLAHLQTQATRHDPQARFDAKWTLIKLLYNRGWEKQRIIDLIFVLDWMMKLPEHFKKQLCQNIDHLEQERKMAYVSSFEEVGIEKGMQAGIQAGRQEGIQTGEGLALQKLLTKRFGELPTETIDQITTASTVQIEAWLDLVLDAPSIDVIFASTRH